MKDIALSERNLEENLVVDILIGADQYWNIANGEVKRGEICQEGHEWNLEEQGKILQLNSSGYS